MSTETKSENETIKAKADSGSKLKEDLAKFKEETSKKGWEDDEVDEKVAEVIENFPWYKYNGNNKRTWKSNLWTLFLLSLVVYLAGGAYLNKNRRLKKQIMDYYFDLQMPYHQMRVSRFLTLPITKFLDLGNIYKLDCLVDNPFHQKEPVQCEFCENITSIVTMKSENPDLMEVILGGEPVKIADLPRYRNNKIGFNELKQLFAENAEAMDDAICERFGSTKFKKTSEFFKLTEEEVDREKLSFGWRNCEGYGTRFYRKLFKRPAFVSNSSEIVLEKVVYIIQPGEEMNTNPRFPQGNAMMFQLQGESTITLSVPTECYGGCEEQLVTKLKRGQMLQFPSEGWNVTTKAEGHRSSILYISGFVPVQS